MTRTTRIKFSPIIRNFNTGFPRVDQVLGRFAESLRQSLETAEGLILRILDGNVTPDEEQPERDWLRFSGNGVSITSPQGKRYVDAAIGYTGVDGVDTETGKVRASRDTVISTDSGITNDYSPTGWDTCDVLILNPASTDHIIGGFAAPTSPDGTIAKLLVVPSGASFDAFISHQSAGSSAANRVVTPDGAAVELNAGECMWMFYVSSESRWYVTGLALASSAITDHGGLTGLGDDDHTLYLLVSGARALGGTWSLGNNTLNNADTINFNGAGSSVTALQTLTMHTSSASVDMNNGTIVDIDTATFNGSGSAINTVQSIAMLTGGTAEIDMNNGDIIDIATAEFNNQEPTAPSTGDMALSISNGAPAIIPDSSSVYVKDYPVHHEFGLKAEGATVTVDIDTSDIGGKDLSTGVVEFYCRMFYIQAGTGDDAVTEYVHYAYYRSRATTTGKITDGSSAYGDRQRNTLGPFHSNTPALSGSNNEIVTFSITLPGATGNGTFMWHITATGIGL